MSFLLWSLTGAPVAEPTLCADSWRHPGAGTGFATGNRYRPCTGFQPPGPRVSL